MAEGWDAFDCTQGWGLHTTHTHCRNGTVACYLSHVRLLQRLQKARHSMVQEGDAGFRAFDMSKAQLGNQTIALILEDDVSVPDTWVPQLKASACALKFLEIAHSATQSKALNRLVTHLYGFRLS
eukprot:17959-Amphidinium_carterae.1